MKFTTKDVGVLSLFTARNRGVFGRSTTVITECAECHAVHVFRTTVGDQTIHEETMLHEPWCSVDARNLRRLVSYGSQLPRV